ncbi:MAG TPA: zf-HC2 domain-containing protein [Casimicrobiaceae bacterium]|nr:zf-HC2 domain-containing protein [Casimicrobiaceae bacterium]
MNPIRKALGHIIRCKDATRLVSRQQDAALSFWQLVTLRLHLSVCAACARFEQQIRFLRTAMRKYSE